MNEETILWHEIDCSAHSIYMGREEDCNCLLKAAESNRLSLIKSITEKIKADRISFGGAYPKIDPSFRALLTKSDLQHYANGRNEYSSELLDYLKTL